MISNNSDPVQWAMLLEELDEGREHLALLIDTMAKEKSIEAEDFAVQLSHIYAHINRGWFMRTGGDPTINENWSKASAYPNDLEPTG